MRLFCERIVGVGGVVGGEVVVSDGRVSSVVECARPGAGSASVDLGALGACWLVPGFIDLHVHGGGGAQCNTVDAGEISAVASFHARHGTTGLLATLVSAGICELVGALGAVRACGSPVVLGAHVEGPFVSPAFAGAMDPGTFLPVDLAVADRLVAAGEGSLAVMTVAPELPGAVQLVARLRAAGVVVSLGHTGASFDEAMAAVRAGARSATHVFNDVAPFHRCAPGVVGAVLQAADVSCELIGDGVHVDPVASRLVLALKGSGGVHLVTDAIAAAGVPDGSFALGAAAVDVLGGRALLRGTDRLAGSTLTMDAAVRFAVSWLGLEVCDAVRLASSNPARVLGVADRKGAIAPGMDADLVALDESLRVVGTMVGGEWVYGPLA